MIFINPFLSLQDFLKKGWRGELGVDSGFYKRPRKAAEGEENWFGLRKFN